MDGFWQHCLDQFKNDLTIQQFNTWIKPLKVSFSDNSVLLVAPNRFVLQWVKEKFLLRIEGFAEAQLGKTATVVLKLDEIQNLSPVKLASANAEDTAKHFPPVVTSAPKQSPSGLNPLFTFTSFVPGKANQLARAAAMQRREELLLAVCGSVRQACASRIARRGHWAE